MHCTSVSLSESAHLPATPDKSPETREGVIVRSTGSWLDVHTEAGMVPSKVRGKFRLDLQGETNPVAVGDRVTLRMNEDDTGMIIAIHPRRNQMSRRAAGRKVGMEHVIVANLDAAWVIQSTRMPRPRPGFIDRFLVMAAHQELAAGVVFNKIDIARPKDLATVEPLVEMYEAAGYQVILTSAKEGDGMAALAEAFAGKINLVAGPSGVGKSSILNALNADLSLATGAVSEKTKKGKHTTTFATLFPLGAETYVVDTPGIREFGLVDVTIQNLAFHFPEFAAYLQECHFPNCTHDHEPDCAVKEAVVEGQIAELRYHSYLNILDALMLGEKDVGR